MSVEASLRFQLLIDCEVINHSYYFQFPFAKVILEVAVRLVIPQGIPMFLVSTSLKRIFILINVAITHSTRRARVNDPQKTHKVTSQGPVSQARRTIEGPAEYPPRTDGGPD